MIKYDIYNANHWVHNQLYINKLNALLRLRRRPQLAVLFCCSMTAIVQVITVLISCHACSNSALGVLLNDKLSNNLLEADIRPAANC